MKAKLSVRVVLTETGAILRNGENGATFSTNLVGARIWEQLTAGASKDDIVNRICSEFLVASKQANCDVEHFIRNLRDNDLLPARTTTL